MNRKAKLVFVVASGVYVSLTLLGQSLMIRDLSLKVNRLLGEKKAYKDSFELAINEMNNDQLIALRTKMETNRDFINIIRHF